MSKNENSNIKSVEEDEISINFSEIYGAIKKYKILIAGISLLFAAIGAFYSLTINNEYESSVKMVPESADSKSSGAAGSLGGLSSLAGLAGINLGGASGVDAIQPAMYPNIVASIPFLQELIRSKIYNPKIKKYQLLRDYLKEHQSNAPIKLFDSEKLEEEKALKELSSDSDLKDLSVPISPGQTIDFINIDLKEAQILKKLNNYIQVEVDKKTMFLTIKCTLQNPVIAANLTSLVQNQLTKYIVNYRTEKVRKEMIFLTSRQAEARKRYDQALFTYSNYKDQNRNRFLNVAKTQEKKLQYEVDLAFNLYSSLTSQLSEAQIKVQKETPIFKVLEPAQVPLSRSSPKRSLITVGAMFIGLFVSLLIVFFKSVNLKELLS
jgi:uncharacterized protein involved in exopolysaccharide biosynthesis